MKTVRTQHVGFARRYNWALIRFKITGWHEQVSIMREIRDDHMRRARGALGEMV